MYVHLAASATRGYGVLSSPPIMGGWWCNRKLARRSPVESLPPNRGHKNSSTSGRRTVRRGQRQGVRSSLSVCSLLPFALPENNPQLTLKLIVCQANPLKCTTNRTAFRDAFY